MALDWLAETSAGLTLKKILNLAFDGYARHRASRRAMQGQDLAGQSSLNNLVKLELEKLAASRNLPSGLQSDEFRNWLRKGENVELFVRVVIARTGHKADISKRAEKLLAANYERATQETRKLAPGRVELAVSYVYGQLRATETGRQALQLALQQWTAAQTLGLSSSERNEFPSNADLARVKAMASALIEAGKRSWKMPRFVAPLTLEARLRQDDRQSHSTDVSELLGAIETGFNLVLFGAGGIGKTTFLLDLSASCLNGERRIPLYVDVAVWAQTNTGLLDYLADMPSARANHVTSDELAHLAEAGRLVIMLNGWNEMATSSKLVCRDRLIQLTTAAKALNFVVVSRTSSDVPNLPDANQVEVRGLTWQGQTAVVRAELGSNEAVPVLDLLAKDTHLRHAAKSPLILRGLIAKARKGAISTSSVFDLLAAAVQAFEEDDQRNLMLSVAPVDGRQRAYLEELACFLTQRLTTICPTDDALRAIHDAASWLAERRLIGRLPEPTAVLNVLVSHHLLHLDGGVVRFAHERFQEYFAAIRLLRKCLVEDSVTPAFLRSAFNQPTWDEPLALVAGKLKGEGEFAAARVRMVKAAAAIDIGLACDLTGICAFSPANDFDLHQLLVTYVNELTASPLQEIQNLGVACQIASGLPAFAEKLWSLIESEDHQTRLHTYRLNGSAISLAQLGTDAKDRVASWSSERRVEFVHEIADNADNYDFLVDLARGEPDLAVRAAAISALFWNFPASDVPVQAWLDAPVEVQTDHNLVSYIKDAIKEGYAGEVVRERLITVAVNHMTDRAKLQCALAFPNEVGPHALDVVFEHLPSSKVYRDDAALVAIARTHAPKRLLHFASELALQGRTVPGWVGSYLSEAPVEVKTKVFERAWSILQGQSFRKLNVDILGPLAAPNQTARCITSWLHYAEADRRTLTDIDRERHRRLGDMLAHAPGDDLLDVVTRRGQEASYNESAQLLELVSLRIGSEDRSFRTANQWLPSVDEMRQLVDLFSEKIEGADVPQDRVRVQLCSIASRVAPAEFGSFLIETCHRHLDAWSTFQKKANRWSKGRTLSHSQNPYLGLYLISALERWGPDALPELLKLVGHLSAMNLIPEAVARIVRLPWADRHERFFSSVNTDIHEGELRRKLGRELRQPDDTFQHWTDEAAKTLGQKLTELVTAYLDKKSRGENWDPREAEYYVGRLAGVVASIPSPEVVEPVHRTLISGLMDIYGTGRALRGLVSQGVYISDPAVIEQLEALYERVAQKKWHDNSMRYEMSAISELMFFVTPTSLLNKPISYYLQQWCRFSRPDEVIRLLGTMHSETAFSGLLELGRELAEKGQTPEDLVPALVDALTPKNLREFFSLVADGTLFAWCCNGWTLERLAPKVAAVLEEAKGEIRAFVEACWQSQSLLADGLICEVLSYIKGCEETRQRFLLKALDAGRAVDPNMPAYEMLRGMFSHKKRLNDSGYQITPKASNELRAKIYARAKGSGSISDGCRSLLASLECGRRDLGRPRDEPRHPALEEGGAWTDVFLPQK